VSDVLVVFISLFVLLSISVPVGLSIGGATILAIVLFTDLDLMVLAQYCVTGVDSF
jgi:C4-dicarboxylate transporter DctM subunit